jgi:hypothetical protein
MELWAPKNIFETVCESWHEDCPYLFVLWTFLIRAANHSDAEFIVVVRRLRVRTFHVRERPLDHQKAAAEHFDAGDAAAAQNAAKNFCPIDMISTPAGLFRIICSTNGAPAALHVELSFYKTASSWVVFLPLFGLSDHLLSVIFVVVFPIVTLVFAAILW